MARFTAGTAETLLDDYCSRLGVLLEHRYYGLALLEAKQQAEKSAIAANAAMLKAKAADRAKNKFLANMAHELRTPLNAIIGFSEIMKLDNIQGRENYPEYTGYIHDAGKHLLVIIDDVLDIARIEEGKFELREEIVALVPLVHETINTILPSCTKKGIAVHQDVMPIDARIYVDPTKLKQVILNLLSNSMKFTDPGGTIEISSSLAETGDLVITIRDTGIGIPPDQLERVLEPFEQVSDQLTRDREGTGLGLAIARRLIQLHGGDLVLSSELGAGTAVFLRLPRERIDGPIIIASSG
jgi:signal transduction histidine kinase